MNQKNNSVSPQDPEEVRKLAGMFQDLVQSHAPVSSMIANSAESVQTSEFASSSVLNTVKDKEVHGKHEK